VTDVRGRHHHRFWSGGLHGCDLRCQGQACPPRFRGFRDCRWCADADPTWRNFPAFPDGIMGPDPYGPAAQQAERFGAELVSDDVIEGRPDRLAKVVKTDSETYLATAVIIATGSKYKELEIPARRSCLGTGSPGARPATGSSSVSRTSRVIGGGDSAVEEALFLTRFGKSVTNRAPARQAARVEDHGGAGGGPTPRSVPVGQRSPWRWSARQAARPEGQERPQRRGDGAPVGGAFIAIGHSPRSELFVGQLPITREGYLEVRGRSTRTAYRGCLRLRRRG